VTSPNGLENEKYLQKRHSQQSSVFLSENSHVMVLYCIALKSDTAHLCTTNQP